MEHLFLYCFDITTSANSLYGFFEAIYLKWEYYTAESENYTFVPIRHNAKLTWSSLFVFLSLWSVLLFSWILEVSQLHFRPSKDVVHR